jgi:orotate phosphoribosyltransferase-like protein
LTSLEQERQAIEWRRNKVMELNSKGFSQADIARTLQITEATISRDVKFLNEQSRSNMRKLVDQKLPYEFERCLTGLTCILRDSWIAADKASGRDKIQALQLAQTTYQMKIDLLTNVGVIQEVVRFIEDKKKEKETLSQNMARKKPEEFPQENLEESSTESTAIETEEQ